MEAGYIGLSLMQPNTHCRGYRESKTGEWGKSGERKKTVKEGRGAWGWAGGGGGGREKVAKSIKD